MPTALPEDFRHDGDTVEVSIWRMTREWFLRGMNNRDVICGDCGQRECECGENELTEIAEKEYRL